MYILYPLINTPTQRGVIISQPKTSFLGVVFDVDHDFEGLRAPKAHLDTVNINLSHHLARFGELYNRDQVQVGILISHLWSEGTVLHTQGMGAT